MIATIVIFGAENDAAEFESRLDSLDVPDVTRYGGTVQVRIPGQVAEGDHFEACRAVAETVSRDFMIGRVSEG